MPALDTLVADPPPLRTDPGGVVRVGDTRVSLDTVIGAFQEGASAEEIVHRYPTLSLPDAYAVLAYYLRHQEQVDAYLVQRQHAAERVRREMEARFPSPGIRERLLARRTHTP